MSLLHLSAALCPETIDDINAVIRGVSVITSGLVARGHDLEVDSVTLSQMQKCAEERGQVPVKVDHKSGAAAVCGFLTNFRQEENKLKADWFLLDNHPQKLQILEVARRMPRGVGLSASFVSPDKPEKTKTGKAAARCQELISVDYVTLPAANPDGMFSRPQLKSRTVNAHRVTDYCRHDLAARVRMILFRERAALTRLIDAAGNNVTIPVPFSGQVEQVQTAYKYSKKPFVRRVAKKAAKVAIGAGLGHWAGRRLGSRAGTTVGAVAGLLFSNASVRGNIRLSLNYSKRITNL